ncbi:Lsr2 protein [Geodermatophilus amargosae]|uniref:Lsr2 protein n=1 Tax=Geodermatophilus amargosae TaxID=1296565 RepID=A0A1I6ZZE4_9ACTN|nr:Lsr2 protein [Geodermatophilus amargosae]
MRFALDQTEYELDLSGENAAAMCEAVCRSVAVARKVSSSGGRRAAAPAKPAYEGVDPAAVRAWAAGRGITVSPHGRIRADVVEQYRAAGN